MINFYNFNILHVIPGALAASCFLLTASDASACAQPIPIMSYRLELARVLDSAEYNSALRQIVNKDPSVRVASISFGAGAVGVKLSNSCSLMATFRFSKPDMVGMCPRFEGVDVKTVCP